MATECLAGARETNERALMFAFEESRDQIFRNAVGWGRDFRAMEEQGRLRVVPAYPEIASLEDHLVEIKREIDEGLLLVPVALRRPPAGRFGLMAAIAAVHAQAESFEETGWGEIVALYDHLARVWPSPVVLLNRAAALGFARGPAAGLEELEELAAEPQLAAYGYLAAARADFLRRLGRVEEARNAYEEALHLTENTVERRFLERRLAECC